MDELLQHCLQALAFDGDLGCNVSRLRDFVLEFYSSRVSMRQNVDDAYNAFVWSLIAQHPSVRIGVLPDGQVTDVYIPPQPRASKKDKAGKIDTQKDNPPAPTLNLIPDASHYALDELAQLYGDRLRIAVDSETCFLTLTGSHAKPAKLTAMVYAALQIIARSRDSGISVLDLSKTTGYDPKTCFYLVKQLVDLNLIVKLRQGGNSQNFCMHKYFFERSVTWMKIRQEELHANGESVENVPDEGEAIKADVSCFQLPLFDPIDPRHLTSLNILRSRLSKLLSHSPDGIQPYTNISAKIGFKPRSRTDRRFFIVRLNDLIKEGTIEKFFMPSLNPETTQNKQLYLRLAPPSRTQQPLAAGSAEEITVDDEMLDSLVVEDAIDQSHVKSTVTLQRQIVDLLRNSSSTGATLNDLSTWLGSYDKKTLELLTSRMEHVAPPQHLADLSVTSVEERHGRERRNRFFILGGYLQLVAREGFQPPSSSYTLEDVTRAGGFMEDRASDFYDTGDEFQAFYQKWATVRARKLTVPTDRKGKKAMKNPKGATEVEQKKWTNPILPDGTRKRGRPPKKPEGAEGRPQKRARKDSAGGVSSEVTIPGESAASTSTGVVESKRKSNKDMPEDASKDVIAPKRKRGRPPGKKKSDTLSADESASNIGGLAHENTARMQHDLQSTGYPVPGSQTIDAPDLSIPGPNVPSDDAGAVPATEDSTEVSYAVVPESLSAPDAAPQKVAPIEIDEEMIGADVDLSDQVTESLPAQLPATSAEGNVSTSMDIDTIMTESTHGLENNGAIEMAEREGSNEGRDADTMGPSLAERLPSNSSTLNETSLVDGDSATSPSKTRRSGNRDGKTNLTALRRENELIRLIENAGGIINSSTTEFITNYMEHIKATVRAGEAASTPVGTRADRRTVTYALDKLESDGRIKLITTNIPTVTGSYRSGRIAYLPTISQEQLRGWLFTRGVGETAYPPHAEDEAEVDRDSPLGLAKQWLYCKDSHEVHHERWHRNPLRSKKLFGQSDAVVREALLMEKQTVSQLYGYLTGKIMRARALHLHTIERLERGIESPFVMSLDERIINISFFENDISLATHCACIPAIAFIEDIKSAVGDEGGRDRPIKDVPGEWKRTLQIGKMRTRERILDLLTFLQSLRLVVPLKETGHANGGTASSFEAMPSDWASRVPLVWPEYWQFGATAPVYLFALGLDPAPFWKNVPTSSRSDVENYWTELKASCLNRSYAEEALRHLPEPGPSGESYSGETRVIKALRRTTSWSADYTLSWYQSEYLKRFVDLQNGNTPLQDSDPERSRLRTICSVIHAPLEVVQKYFLSAHETLLRELDKKQRRDTDSNEERQKADMRLLLTQKKVEAVRNREATWDAMVEKVHPGLVKGVAEARLRRLKQSYVRGNVVQDSHQWELQIQDAIKAAEKMRSSRKLFPNVSHAARGPIIRNQPVTDFSQLPVAAQGKSVESLVNMQERLTDKDGRTEDTGASKGKRARARKGKGKETTRRQRFPWNADYDELARDAYAILRSRCRTHYRLEWAAIEQVFPSVSPNGVRSRLAMLKDQPGAAQYLERLEICWHELWIKKRGTPELPDPNPRNPTEFDLKAHLQYLRKYLDKNAIRVGVSTFDEEEYAPLPEDLNELLSVCDLDERRPAQPSWDFLFNSMIAEETRERLFLEAPFTLEVDNFLDENPQSDIACIAESALKIVAGAPEESYNASDAAGLLYEVGKAEIDQANENLLLRNVLSKRVKGPSKTAPGRTVKISEMNQNALNGPIAKDLFADATQLEESYAVATDEWREWPLTSTDGDTAALLQLFSDHQVEFDVDTSHAQATRATIEGNSRKVDDEDIELSLRVKLSDRIAETEKQTTPLGDGNGVPENDSMEGHGESVVGKPACCGIRSGGVVDCVKCIEEARVLMNDWSEDDRRVAESILQAADSRGQQGIKIEELGALLDTGDETFIGVIHRLHTLREPLIYLTGYNSTVVVSAKYAGSWALTLPSVNMPILRFLPRRWLDVTGNRVKMVWEAGLRAVVGLIHLRPGISQAEVRWRLKAVYDRQEILELLNHLLSNGTLEVYYHGAWSSDKTVCIDVLSKEEERKAYWAVRKDKRWYHSL